MPRYILDEKDTRTVFDIEKGAVLVGRSAESDIAILDLRASREHCRVEQHGDQYLLIDLGSQNGTKVNGERITSPQVLQHGDTIVVGQSTLRFDLPQETTLQPPEDKPLAPINSPLSGWLMVCISAPLARVQPSK